MQFVQILNTYIDNITTLELLERLNESGGFVMTANVDHLVKIQNDYEFIKIYKQCSYRVCDSKIIQYASQFLGNPIKEKISGSDLFPAFYEYNKNNEKIKIFLLGGLEGVAQKAQEEINKKVGHQIVIENYSPYFGFQDDEDECLKIIEKINQSGATVLAVGLGSPKQEKWIAKYRNNFQNIKVFLAIGATIDFEAGNKPRAPKWMSDIGLEWFYRLTYEPKRLWRRYLIESLPFFWLILLQKLNLYKIPAAQQIYALPVGEFLCEAGLINSEQKEKVLQAQEGDFSGVRFGEILDKWGWLKKETVDFYLEDLPEIWLKKERCDLLEFLKKAHILTEEKLNLLTNELADKSLNPSDLSNFLVEQGWIKQKTIDWILGLQKQP